MNRVPVLFIALFLVLYVSPPGANATSRYRKARRNVVASIRTEATQLDCWENEHFVQCGPEAHCENSCENRFSPPNCRPPKFECTFPRCICNDGFVRDASRRCIRPHECTEDRRLHPVAGRPEHRPRPGGHSDPIVEDPSRVKYPSASDVACGTNEVYHSCGKDCEKRCVDVMYGHGSTPCVCVNRVGGCKCIDGYARANEQGQCVPHQHCSQFVAVQPPAPRQPEGEDVVPPRREEDVVPPRREEDVVPPRRDEDVVPPRQEEDVVPPRRDEDVVPPRQEEDVVPPRRVEDVPPATEDDEAVDEDKAEAEETQEERTAEPEMKKIEPATMPDKAEDDDIAPPPPDEGAVDEPKTDTEENQDEVRETSPAVNAGSDDRRHPVEVASEEATTEEEPKNEESPTTTVVHVQPEGRIHHEGEDSDSDSGSETKEDDMKTEETDKTHEETKTEEDAEVVAEPAPLPTDEPKAPEQDADAVEEVPVREPEPETPNVAENDEEKAEEEASAPSAEPEPEPEINNEADDSELPIGEPKPEPLPTDEPKAPEQDAAEEKEEEAESEAVDSPNVVVIKADAPVAEEATTLSYEEETQPTVPESPVEEDKTEEVLEKTPELEEEKEMDTETEETATERADEEKTVDEDKPADTVEEVSTDTETEAAGELLPTDDVQICMENQRWENCSGPEFCVRSCIDNKYGIYCSQKMEECNPTCMCKDGYVWYDDKCMKEENCGKEQESLTCSETEKYMACGNQCENTCENVVNNENKPIACLKICNPGACGCKDGYARHDGQCVKEDECQMKLIVVADASPESVVCPEDEVFMPCGNQCENTCENVVNNENKPIACLKICRKPGACGCKNGYARIAGECIKEEECLDDSADSTDSTPESPACSENEEFYLCGNHCENTCNNVVKNENKPIACLKICNPGACKCKEGYARHEGQCLKEEDCSLNVVDSDTSLTCGPNERVTDCGPTGLHCQKSCDPNEVRIACTRHCGPPACVCAEGFVRQSHRRGMHECIPESACPTYTLNQVVPYVSLARTGHVKPFVSLAGAGRMGGNREENAEEDMASAADECPENETMNECGNHCETLCSSLEGRACTRICNPPACACKVGFARNGNGKCVANEDCPETCGENQTFVTCSPASRSCEATCNRDIPVICARSCGPPRCICQDGFVRKSQDSNECIPKEDCTSETETKTEQAREVCGGTEEWTSCGPLSRACEARCPGSFPSPLCYKGCGPPTCICAAGTGKTSTLVEAAKQTLKLNSKARLLLCAPSNNAADLLAHRILEDVEAKYICRMHALCRPLKSVPEDVLNVSNLYTSIYGSKSFDFPEKSEFVQYRVIITTLVTAGRLVSAQFDKGFFTHVFIDEAGQATEPEALIAIAGIIEPSAASNTHLVLAGDCKQLGPVLQSVLAAQCGLGMSLIERLMTEVELYQRGADAGGTGVGLGATPGESLGPYNSQYITKLLKNYRSHPDIFAVSSRLFYDNELIACADKKERESLCDWKELPTKGVPLIVHGVIGTDEREQNSPSYFNRIEIIEAMSYVDKLIDQGRCQAEQIGIIAPYRKQVDKFRQIIRHNRQNKYEGMTVGSVEEFQGQERLVIIITTVRSNESLLATDRDFKLGFVCNEKRFNTALTRAKALTIVIGNPFVLCTDPNWRSFIKFSYEKGAYTGMPISPSFFDDDDNAFDPDMAQLTTDLGEMRVADFEAVAKVVESETPLPSAADRI